ncbi:NadS family protein [Chitinispirillales bacterium ANBcel5]|uniref:NadS family protein n=1 Tax=Cellulosispirillum alkaliphilum TaxID=3039283 RepID=UPI002A52B739|nr:NadS family protein [Chitinispirillales bacterium ANBcel5]
MKEQDFNKLLQSVKEAGEIKAGNRKASRVCKYEKPNIKAIRKRLNVSQSEFALMIGVSKSTLQNWEQGRREPDGPAKALLKVADKNPKAVFEALHDED